MLGRDRWFKELLSRFFLDFLELFVPELANPLEPNSIRFLRQEHFVNLTAAEEEDLRVEVKQAGEAMAILGHLEAQSSSEANFMRRMDIGLQGY